MVEASVAAGEGGEGGVERSKVVFEEGGEGGVALTWCGGRLEVASPEDTVCWVVVRESEAPCRDLRV